MLIIEKHNGEIDMMELLRTLTPDEFWIYTFLKNTEIMEPSMRTISERINRSRAGRGVDGLKKKGFLTIEKNKHGGYDWTLYENKMSERKIKENNLEVKGLEKEKLMLEMNLDDTDADKYMEDLLRIVEIEERIKELKIWNGYNVILLMRGLNL